MQKRENVEKSTKKRDVRQIRNAIVMICVSLTMLSSATYAWFTLSNQPKVTGMALTAGTVGGLKISDTANGTYGAELKLKPNENTQLNPVTTTAVATFGKPIYTAGVVDKTEAIPDTDIYKTYVAKYEFYLKAEGSGTYNVCLMGGPTGTDKTNRSGCFVEKNPDKTVAADVESATCSIRIGLQKDSDWAIYEPNTDQSVAHKVEGVDRAKNSVTPGATTKLYKQNKDANFTNPTSVQSPPLFSITANTPAKVTMYIWIEGTDDDCANKIQADEILAQLQFVSTN